MTKANLLIKICCTAFLIFALWGCGKQNNSAPAVNVSGQHPSNWIDLHKKEYSKAFLIDQARQCRECHGLDLMGGIAKVGCSTTSCHNGGHPPRPATHQFPFTDPALHGPEATKNLIICQECHGEQGGAGSNPRFIFNVTIDPGKKGCENCHPVNAGHPKPWLGHNKAGNQANACALCHGASFEGGSGPKCSSCHVNLIAGTLPTLGSCISCHAKPPATGAHTAHAANSTVPGLLGICAPCHSGAGTGTSKHANGFVNVSTAVEYNAKSGPARLNSDKTCSNVSCHGGLTTPPWSNGTIDATAECTVCHTIGTASQTPQFNSYFSGQHAKHVQEIGLICVDCHDMTVISGSASHFSGLTTPTFELNPQLTIKGKLNYIKTSSSATCAPGKSPTGFSIGVCHNTLPW